MYYNWNRINIMLIDDDVVYHPNIIRNLWNQFKSFNNSVSLGYAGRIWLSNQNHLKFRHLHRSPQKLLKVDILETYHLVIHPSHIFLEYYNDWIQFIKDTKNKCPDSIFTDDIVISLWCHLKNIPKFVLKGPKVKLNHHNTPQLSTLNLEGRNDKVFISIYKDYL